MEILKDRYKVTVRGIFKVDDRIFKIHHIGFPTDPELMLRQKKK